MACERSTRCVKLPDAHARHRSCIAQGSCCIAQSHGQDRIAITIKRIISPYVQNLIALATRGRDGERNGEGGRIN